MRSPNTLAALLVGLTTRFLPPGPVRDRYRQEFLAELHDLDRPGQLRHGLGVLSRGWGIRQAVKGAPAMEETMLRSSAIALHCRLHLYHHYVLASTDDGQRYRRCRDCGKDSPAVGNGPGDWMSPAGIHGWN